MLQFIIIKNFILVQLFNINWCSFVTNFTHLSTPILLFLSSYNSWKFIKFTISSIVQLSLQNYLCYFQYFLPWPFLQVVVVVVLIRVVLMFLTRFWNLKKNWPSTIMLVPISIAKRKKIWSWSRCNWFDCDSRHHGEQHIDPHKTKWILNHFEIKQKGTDDFVAIFKLWKIYYANKTGGFSCGTKTLN